MKTYFDLGPRAGDEDNQLDIIDIRYNQCNT